MTTPTTQPPLLPLLSVQLYSVRDALARDRARALADLAGTGLRWVEPFGLGAAEPAQVGASLDAARALRRDLDAAGLRASSAHATFGPDLAALAEELDVLGTDTVFLPVPAAAPPAPMEAFAERSALDALADRLTGAAQELGRHGITVGYHNHWWEWERLEGSDGAAAYDHFLSRCGPSVTVELDAYWALQAGQDPAAIAAALGARVVALHLKSGPPRGEPLTSATAQQLRQVPFAQGALALDPLLDASSARWHVLECDHTDLDVVELLGANAAALVDAGRSAF